MNYRQKLAFLVAALALWGAMTSTAAASFCGGSFVRDYSKPLRALPLSSPIPEQPPFAPPGLTVRPVFNGGERLIYLGSPPGIYLHNSDKRPLELGWTVRVVVSRLAADGSVVPISENLTTVGTLTTNILSPALGGVINELGSFRVDTTFYSQAGDQLGSYFEYVQAVPKKLRVRLGLSRRVVSPGGILNVRMENAGTLGISYGLAYVLERWEGGRWRSVPQQRKFLALLRVLPAGRAAECQVVRLFDGATPGRYRIKRSFWAPLRLPYAHPIGPERRFVVKAFFRVRGA